MTVTDSAFDLLTLLRLPGVGPRGAVKTLEEGSGRTPELQDDAEAREAVAAIVEDCAALGIGVVGWFDEGFPARLQGIPDPPAVLFYRGDLELASERRSVAIVGTREPTEWGQRATEVITSGFAERGWVVVSGLALGVDTIAHRRALARGTATIAVLGNGLSSIYPAVNEDLAEQIVDAGGLLVAEVAPRARVEGRALVKRDRLQSGLTALTVVCQGGVRSGAMHTARFAAEQGRPLYVAAVSRGDEPFSDQDEGTQALLNKPAAALAEILPPWRSATRRATGRQEPVARPVDEASIATLDALDAPDEPGSNRLTLF